MSGLCEAVRPCAIGLHFCAVRPSHARALCRLGRTTAHGSPNRCGRSSPFSPLREGGHPSVSLPSQAGPRPGCASMGRFCAAGRPRASGMVSSVGLSCGHALCGQFKDETGLPGIVSTPARHTRRVRLSCWLGMCAPPAPGPHTPRRVFWWRRLQAQDHGAARSYRPLVGQHVGPRQPLSASDAGQGHAPNSCINVSTIA